MRSEANGPRQIDRYVIHHAIASGGMARVHLGRLLGQAGFSRTVAIKRLHAQYAEDPEFVAMFVDEALLAARIRHPNVVPTIDVVAAEGELFLVMEYVHGESLSRLLRAARDAGERTPPPIVSSIILALLNGLHAAHEARDERGVPLGIVHRDVSPQNVIVGVDGMSRVFDFGIAKAVGRAQQATRDGVLKGKLAYMAPEQLGDELVTRHADIYACGLVLWEALTGHRVFEADSEPALIAKLLNRKIVPPSDHLPTNLSKTVDTTTFERVKALDALTLRALALAPADRFATAREMAIALERALPPATTSEVAAWVDRMASGALAKRAELVSELESSIRGRSMGARTLMDAMRASVSDTIQDPPRKSAPDLAATMQADPPRVTAMQRSRTAVVLLVAIALGIIGAFVLRMRSEARPTTDVAPIVSVSAASPANAAPVATPASTPPVASAASAAPVASAASTPPVASAASTPPIAPVVPAIATAATAAPTTRSASGATRAASSNRPGSGSGGARPASGAATPTPAPNRGAPTAECWTYDSKGMKHFDVSNPACL